MILHIPRHFEDPSTPLCCAQDDKFDSFVPFHKNNCPFTKNFCFHFSALSCIMDVFFSAR